VESLTYTHKSLAQIGCSFSIVDRGAVTDERIREVLSSLVSPSET
jgi:hypothetical protein